MSTNNTNQERITQKLSSDSGPTRKKNIGVIVTAITIIALLVIALVLILSKQPTDDVSQRNVVVTPENVDEVIANMNNQKVSAGTYEVTMNTTWEFEKGDSASTNAYVENAVANTNDVYFDVVRSDTGATIFSSPTIPVGSHLENITLDTPLEAGNHACVLTYHLLDESGKPVSTLSVNLTITVTQ